MGDRRYDEQRGVFSLRRRSSVLASRAGDEETATLTVVNGRTREESRGPVGVGMFALGMAARPRPARPDRPAAGPPGGGRAAGPGAGPPPAPPPPPPRPPPTAAPPPP